MTLRHRPVGLCSDLPRAFLFFLTAACFAFILSGPAFAYDDGFSAAQTAEGESYAIYFHEIGTNLPAIIKRLNVGAADELLAGRSRAAGGSDKEKIAAMVDTLFSRVCDILDMHPQGDKGAIKICRDKQELQKVYRGQNGQDIPSDANAFYDQSSNTIYVTSAGFDLPVITHEMAHAVISRYYSVLPHDKQEVLAVHVEYAITGKGSDQGASLEGLFTDLPVAQVKGVAAASSQATSQGQAQDNSQAQVQSTPVTQVEEQQAEQSDEYQLEFVRQ